MAKKDVPLRLLLEQYRRHREFLDNFDWLVGHLCVKADRERLWKIRQELIEILLRDILMKRGIYR